MDRKPDVKRAYFDLQEVIAGTREELIARRRAGVKDMFNLGDTAALDVERLRQQERKQTLKDLWLRLRLQLVDKNVAVIDRVRALIKRGTRINPDDDPRYALEERNYLGGKLKAFTETHFLPIYQALTTGGIDWHTFGEALFYQRIIAGDRSELANPRGLSPTSAQELYDDLTTALDPEQRRDLTQAVTDFRAVITDVAEQAYDAGLYTDETYQEMQKNPAYVAFRVIDYIERDVTSRVHHQIGTLKDITNPADATMLKVLATLRAIEYQRMKVTTFDFLTQYFPTDIAQATEVWTGKGRKPVESRDRKQELITYYERGRLRGKYVDPYIASSLTNESIGHNNAVVAGLRWINGGLFRPVFTTLNVGFQTFNVGRDFFRLWKNTPTMTLRRALRRYVEAVPLARARAFGPSDTPTPRQRQAQTDLLEAEQAQILSVTFNDLISGREVEDTQIEDTLSKLGVGTYGPKKATPYLKPLTAIRDFIEAMGDFIETLPKAAAIYEYRGTGTIADIPADVRSRIRRKIGSPDFLAGGTWKPVANELLLFSNAITQAIRADLEVARDPQTRSGFWWKTAALNVAPKLLMFAVLYGLAQDDDDDEDTWFSQWQRAARGISRVPTSPTTRTSRLASTRRATASTCGSPRTTSAG